MQNVQTSAGSVEMTRISSGASPELIQSVAKLGQNLGFIQIYLTLHEAESLWQKGFCVEIVLDGVKDSSAGSNWVRVASKNPFGARVRHKFEGAEIEAPIQGTLEGEKSLAPLEKSMPPVLYYYDAPGEKDKKATVTLETRSKRGAAKKQIDFVSNLLGYTVDGQIDQFTFTWVICNPFQPFTINATAEGASAVLEFTPESQGLTGTFSFSGGGDGFTLSGEGPYHILEGEGGNGTLEMNRDGCVDIGQCQGAIDKLPLTPLEDASGCE